MPRIGTTSYVYAGGLIENAQRLAGQVDDIELILFETDSGESNIPDAAAVRTLRHILDDAGMTCTVHLPEDLRHTPGADHPSLRMARRVIDLTAPLLPGAWVFHIEGSGAGSADWLDQATRAAEALRSCVGAASRLALENLETYAPEYLEPIMERVGLGRTLDIGHLWKMGRDPLHVMARWLPHASVVHLHGVVMDAEPRVDHLSLEHTPEADLRAVLAGLRGWRGVLTLEVFEADYFSSRRVFDSQWSLLTR